MPSCASMVESLRVTRRCWLGLDGGSSLARIPPMVEFKISYTMPGGFERVDARMFDAFDLLDLPRGAVPLMTPVYTLPYDGHPGACTAGMAYLIRTVDSDGLEDVVARFARKPNPHAAADAIFETTPPAVSGPMIFPLPIEELRMA